MALFKNELYGLARRGKPLAPLGSRGFRVGSASGCSECLDLRLVTKALRRAPLMRSFACCSSGGLKLDKAFVSQLCGRHPGGRCTPRPIGWFSPRARGGEAPRKSWLSATPTARAPEVSVPFDFFATKTTPPSPRLQPLERDPWPADFRSWQGVGARLQAAGPCAAKTFAFPCRIGWAPLCRSKALAAYLKQFDGKTKRTGPSREQNGGRPGPRGTFGTGTGATFAGVSGPNFFFFAAPLSGNSLLSPL